LLDDILAGVGPLVSAKTLEQWGLPAVVVDAAAAQNNWAYDHLGDCDVTDVLLVAHVLSLAKARQRDQLPRLDETPAFRQITQQRLSPKQSMSVLAEVQIQTAQLRQLLS